MSRDLKQVRDYISLLHEEGNSVRKKKTVPILEARICLESVRGYKEETQSVARAREQRKIPRT